MLSVSLLLLTVLLMRMVRKRRNAFLIQKRRALGLDSLVPAGPGGRSQSNDAAKMDEAALPQRIAQFYDTQSELWERVWGEHMHHGFYGLDGSQTEKDDRQAQVDMMDELLVFSGVDAMLRAAVGIGNQRIRVLDVGCGIGGASRHIATRYGANVHVTGITLSPVQASRAQVLTRQLRLEDRVETMVANALHLPFPDNSFDVVWSMESAEHMPNKLRFMQECARVLRPSGRLAMTAWCHRACPPPFGNVDRQIYRKVCEQYCIPYLCALNEFENYAWQNGLIQVRTADWTRATLPFWPAVARSAFRRRALVGLLEGGWPLIRAALAVRWMIQGFRRGIFVIGALSAEKPASS
jgi:tocopherol O-methyltransferase